MKSSHPKRNFYDNHSREEGGNEKDLLVGTQSKEHHTSNKKTYTIINYIKYEKRKIEKLFENLEKSKITQKQLDKTPNKVAEGQEEKNTEYNDMLAKLKGLVHIE